MKFPLAFRDAHARLEANLDAYVDGALDLGEQQRIEAHLETCEGCRVRVAESRRLKLLVGALPAMPAPRSFAITEAMLKPARPAPGRRSGLIGGAMRGMQGLSAAAIALFAVLVVVDASGSSPAATTDLADSAATSVLESDGATRDEGSGDDAGSAAPAHAEDGDEQPQDAETLKPDSTATGGVGAAGNQQPEQTPAVESDDDSAANQDEPTDLPPPDDRSAGEPGTDAGEAALYQAEGDGDGFDGMRLAQVMAAALAVLAAAGYLVTRRFVVRTNR